MIIPNHCLTDERLILKARFLVQLREQLMYQKALLLKKKETLIARDIALRAKKAKPRWSAEVYGLQTALYAIDVTLQESAMDRQFVISALADRGLCERGQECDFLGVWRHED